MKPRLYNIDRQQSACFGGDPAGIQFDFCIIVDEDDQSLEPITGQMKPNQIWQGQMKDAQAAMDRFKTN